VAPMLSTPRLSPAQEEVVRRWFPDVEVVADLSWGLVDTVVLHVRHEQGESIIKAGGPGNHHIGREIAAHEQWTKPWRDAGRCARLQHGDRDQSILATNYLPGTLVKDHPAADDADTYRQAGVLLASFHAQQCTVSKDYESRADANAIAWLDRDHRIDAVTEARLREAIAGHCHEPVELVPTHGDWQPRNWLIHEDQVSVIDLGRADRRPALTDLARLARQEWQGRPDLEEAFLEGYGSDPREPAAWRRTLLREAIGTAVWAYLVGDEPFEAQGHRMIAQSLELG